MHHALNFNNSKVKSLLVASYWSVLMALQAVCLVTYLLKNPPSVMISGTFKEFLPQFKPEWEHYVYWTLLGVGGALQFLAVRMIAKGKEFWKDRFYLIVETLIVFFMASALFKVIVYGQAPFLAWRCVEILLVTSVLIKMFHRSIYQFFNDILQVLYDPKHRSLFLKIADGLMLLLIFLIIYTPNFEAVVGRMYIGEQFKHFDSFIASPTYSLYSGNQLFIDNACKYGVGIPVYFTFFLKMLGEFSFVNLYTILIYSLIAYYMGMYIFMRRWFGSWVVAAFALLIAIRLKMFHYGVNPFILTFPSATSIRHMFDIFVFFCVLQHARTLKQHWIWLASAVCGYAIFHMVSTGVYLTAAFFGYCCLVLLIPHTRSTLYKQPKDAMKLAGIIALPFIVFFLCFYRLNGNVMFTSEFWLNYSESPRFYMVFGGMPYFHSVETMHRHFQGLMGVIVPLTYLFTLIVTGTMVYLKKWKTQRLVAPFICMYAMGQLHYHIFFSAGTNYYASSGLAFGYISAFWLWVILSGMKSDKQRRVLGLTAVIIAYYALATNHNFIAYPNKLNWSKNPMIDRQVRKTLENGAPYFHHLYHYPEIAKAPVNSLGSKDENLFTEDDLYSDEQIAEYFRRDFNFPKDAALIQKLTDEDEKVCLIASFDNKFLSQARRRPYLYYLSSIVSRPLKLRTIGITYMDTSEQLEKTLKQLNDDKLEYIFMEKLYLYRGFPKALTKDMPSFEALMDFVHANYEASEYGEYLVAMKRK